MSYWICRCRKRSGRNEAGKNEVAIEIAADQVVRIEGISDTVVKRFAMNLYKNVSIEVHVYAE